MISDKVISRVMRLFENGVSKSGIAKILKVQPETVKRYLRSAFKAGDIKPLPKLPKILLLDIETSPMIIAVWGLFKQRPNIDQVLKDWFIISWSAKWLFEPEIISDCVTSKEAIRKNDKRIVESIWNILNKADMIIAHNAKKFDVRKINARFILNGLDQPAPYQIIDTLKVVQKQFAFSSHKLDYLARLFDFDVKLDTDYELWLKCMEGDQESLDYMLHYNKHDVRLLEDIYLRIRNWIPSHPNVGLYMDGKVERCTVCGNAKDFEEIGLYYTPAGRFKAYRCPCGAPFRSRYSDLSKQERKNLLMSLAR